MLLTAVVFFVVLSILVCIHELGHFTAARIIGVAVEEFGFGLPPRIWGKKIGKTMYSINWLPIGGFVKLAGEDDEEKHVDVQSKSAKIKTFFWARSKTERSIILLAGVAMNFLLAVCITSYLLTQGIFEPAGRVHIEKIVDGAPAAIAGLQADDVIVSIASSDKIPKVLKEPKELIEFTDKERGREVSLVFLRDNQEYTTTLIPREHPPAGEGPMGVAISDLEEHRYSLVQAPVKAVEINLTRARDMFTGVASVIGKLLRLQSPGADVAGPIGIAKVTGQAVKFGFKAVLEFMSILSLNLAVLNVLPIPALDGGRFLFVILEKVMGRKVAPAFEQRAHQVGMVVLLFLVVLISINDILRLAKGG